MKLKTAKWILPLAILSMIVALTTGCEEEEDPLITYTLSLTVNPEGSGEVSGAGDYEEGETVSLNATSNEGYEFINWTDAHDEEVSGSANFSFTMPAENVILTANFEEESPFSVDEYEPNDSRAEAAQIDLETDIEATFFPEGDVDYFKFTTANTDDEWDLIEYSVTQVSEDVRIDLTVYDKNGEEVFNDRAANEGANLITTMETQGGTYFVKIENYLSDDIGRYTLNVRNMYANDEFAPNHTRETAHDIGRLPAHDIEGVLISKEEEDWFIFTTENDGVWDHIEFDVTHVSEDIRLDITVYDENGVEVFHERTGDEGAVMSPAMETLGGTYHVKITNYFSDPGEYTLSITNLHANDQYAPNYTRAAAYDLGILPAIGIGGALISKDEVDWFKFTTENEDYWDYIEFHLTDITSDLRVTISVYDDQGNEVFTENADTEGADLTRKMATMGGEYYISVTSYYSDPGDYTLNIENLDANDEYAPNHSFKDAHDLGMIPVSDVNGVLLSDDEEDLFKFTAESNGEYDILFDVTGVSAELRVRMKVYDEQGNEIFTETADNEGAGLSATMSTTGGTFYVRFTIYYSNPGEYTLAINKL